MANEKVSITPTVLRLFSPFSIIRFRLLPNLPGFANYLIDYTVQHCPAWVDSLIELEMGGCSYLSDQALLKISRFSKLQTVGISYCNRITDMGLVHLMALKNLSSVDLRGNDIVTEVGLSVLKTMNLKMVLCDQKGLTPMLLS